MSRVCTDNVVAKELLDQTYKAPPIPMPPETTNAPVVVEVAFVVPVIDTVVAVTLGTVKMSLILL